MITCTYLVWSGFWVSEQRPRERDDWVESDCLLLKFYLINDVHADKIPNLDSSSLLFLSNWGAASINGGLPDTQPKVMLPFFRQLTAVLESWRQLQSYTSDHPLSNLMNGAINNNPLQWCTASTFSKSLHISWCFIIVHSHVCESQVCGPGQLTPDSEDSNR